MYLQVVVLCAGFALMLSCFIVDILLILSYVCGFILSSWFTVGFMALFKLFSKKVVVC